MHSPDYDHIEKIKPAYQPIHDHQPMIEKISLIDLKKRQVFPDPKVPGKANNR